VRERAGLLGALVGLAAAGAAAGLAVERYAVRRVRAVPGDPFAEEPFGLLPADRSLTVSGDDGVALHVEIVEPDRRPEAPELTVVFVHGFCLDMGTWHFQRRRLARARTPRCRMVFYDQPGHGGSGRKPSGDYSIDELGRDLRSVLQAVAPDGPLVLVGHSMGGMTIMALAEQEPELFAGRVVGVGLISSSAGDLDAVALGLPEVLTRVRRPVTPLVAAALRIRPALLEKTRTVGSDLAYLLTRRYGFGSHHPSPSLVEYVERMNASTSVEVIAGYLRTLSEHDRYAALDVFDGIETLIVCGDADLLTPVEHTREMARLLPGAELVEVGDGGHVTVLEHADLVNAHLLAFLRRAVRSVTPDGTAREASPGGPAERGERRRARAERAALAEDAGPTQRRRMRDVRRAQA